MQKIYTIALHKQLKENIMNSNDYKEQLIDEPKKAVEDWQESNQSFLNECQKITANIPHKAQSIIQKQQELMRNTQEQLLEASRETPPNINKMASIWLDFQNKQFSSYLDILKEQQQNSQKLWQSFQTHHIEEPIKRTRATVEKTQGKVSGKKK